MGGMSRGDEDIPSLDLLLFGEEPSYDDPDAPEASPSDVAYASVLAEAFREGWVAGKDAHPTWFSEETGRDMRLRLTRIRQDSGGTIPWMHAATLVATFRRRGYYAWKTGLPWEDAAGMSWMDGQDIVMRWFSYAVANVPLGDEPPSERRSPGERRAHEEGPSET